MARDKREKHIWTDSSYDYPISDNLWTLRRPIQRRVLIFL